MFGGSRRRSVASAEQPPGRAPLAEAGFLNEFVVPLLKAKGAAPAASPAPLAQADGVQADSEPSDARRAAELPPRPGKRPAAPGGEERGRAQHARLAEPSADLPDASDVR